MTVRRLKTWPTISAGMVGCVILLCLSVSQVVYSQPRPGSFTTITTSDTSVTSACIGANSISAPSTCLGGLQSGPFVANQAITLPSFTPASTTNRLYNVGGTLTWNGSAVAVGGAVGPGTLNAIARFTGANSVGDSLLTQSGTVLTAAATLVSNVFGASSFTAGAAGDESLTVRNTSAGVANRGVVFLGNDASATLGTIAAHSSTFTTSGAAIANGVKLTASGVGGLSLQASDATGIVHFFTGTGTVERGQITAAGLWNWSTFGLHLFSASGTGANVLTVRNTTAGAGNSGQVEARSDTSLLSLISLASTFTSSAPFVQAGNALYAEGVGGLSIAANNGTGAVRIYTGGTTLRATFDASGNFNLGSTNIMDSPGVPTVTGTTGGTVTIAGRNTGFAVAWASLSPTQIDVAFNMTYTTGPVCVASTDMSAVTVRVIPTPTAVTLIVSSALTSAKNIWVVCRGY